jgi:hypothetical protein
MYMNNNWRPGKTILALDLDLVRQPSEALVAFVPPVSIEDHPLLWMVVRSQIYYPKYILACESRKLVTLLSWVSALFRPTFKGGIRWRFKHHTEAGSQVLGAWSPSLDGDLEP